MPEAFDQKIIGDPSKSSLIEGTLNLEFERIEPRFYSNFFGRRIREIEIYVDRKTKEEFCKIDSRKAPSQKLLALILKGIINVSDIVKVGDYYYSHQQNFNHIINSTPENIISEIEADIFLLTLVFGDDDHYYYPINTSARKIIEKEQNSDSFLEHQNLRADELDGKSNFFDFGEIWLDRIMDHKVIDTFKQKLTNKIFNSDPNRQYIINILRRKIGKLLNWYSGSEIESFKAIVQKSGVELTDEEQKTLFKNIQLRLKALNEVLSELEPSTLETKT